MALSSSSSGSTTTKLPGTRPWQRWPAVILAILHAIGGVSGAAFFASSNHPGIAISAGSYGLAGTITSTVLALHMFAPATVQKFETYLSIVDRYVPRVEQILAQVSELLQASTNAAKNPPQPAEPTVIQSVMITAVEDLGFSDKQLAQLKSLLAAISTSQVLASSTSAGPSTSALAPSFDTPMHAGTVDEGQDQTSQQ